MSFDPPPETVRARVEADWAKAQQEMASPAAPPPDREQTEAIIARGQKALDNALRLTDSLLAPKPNLKPGDLDYVRSRLRRMAAFLEGDRRAQLVIDHELVVLLDRYFNGRS